MSEDLTGQRIANYEVLERIGQGGMATVYLARESYLEREVALKIFRYQEGDTITFLKRFEREARVVGQLDHQHIVKILTYGEYWGKPYYVMPYFSRGSLRDYLKQQKILTIHEVVQLLSPILQALQYAHDRGLVHRDIKPDNMLFQADGTLVLSDFGLVKVLSEVESLVPANSLVTYTGSIVGTPRYMAPEQIRENSAPSSDVYSMGVVLYEMLTGTVPFRADSPIHVLTMHLSQTPRPPRELNPAVSPELEQVVMHALAKDPQYRIASPLALLSELLTVLALTPEDSSVSVLTTAHKRTPELLGKTAQTMVLHSQEIQTALQSPLLKPFTTVPEVSTQSRSYAEPPRTISRPQRIHPIKVLMSATLLLLIVFASWGGWHFIPSLLNSWGKSNLTSSKSPSTVTLPAPEHYETSCPAKDKGRVAQMPPLAQGKTQYILYTNADFKNETQLTRYNPLNGQSESIRKFGRLSSSNITLSTDGQWMLFLSQAYVESQGDHQMPPHKVQIMRIDGKGLQTLYCVDAKANNSLPIEDLAWSPFGYGTKYITFTQENPEGIHSIQRLNLADGQMQNLFYSPVQYKPIGWLSPNTLLLHDVQTKYTARALYELSIAQNTREQAKLSLFWALKVGYQTYHIASNNLTLYIAEYSVNPYQNGSYTKTEGPSTVKVLEYNDDKSAGKDEQLIFRDDAHAITDLSISHSRNTLLFIVNNSHDVAQNGVWMYDSRSQQRKLLLKPERTNISILNASNPQATFSPDETMYVALTRSPQALGYENLHWGKLDGSSTPITFASATDDQVLRMVGWVTI